MAKKPNNLPKTASGKMQADIKPRQKGASLKFLCTLLAIISFAVYANTLQNGYVMDDITVTASNTIVTKGFSGIPELLVTTRLKGFEQGADAESYRPVPMITHAIEYQLFGPDPTSGHFVNILMFIGCVIALFLFLNTLFDSKRIGTAFIAALLFALHPIHTEVVANIKSRDELLCFLFAFLALNLFAGYAISGKMKKLVIGAVLLLLSLLSKETGISFIVIIPLVYFFYINEDKKRSIIISAATVIAVLCYLGARGAVLGTDRENAITFIANPLVNAPDIATKIATAFTVLGMYLKLLFLPSPLVSDYSYNCVPFVSFSNILALLSLILYIGLGFFGIYRLIKKPKDPWAFSILFYLATIALFSNIFFLVYSEIAERFLFFASVGFCIAVALSIEKWMIKQPIADSALITSKRSLTILLPVCLIFFTLTAMRNADWKDNYSLFKADLEKVPGNSRMYYYLANTISYKDPNAPVKTETLETDEDCIKYLEKAVTIYPEFSEAHALMGMILSRMQKLSSAMYHDSLAVVYNPKNSIAAYNMGIGYYALKKYPEAISYIKRSVAFNPGFVMGNLNLARCYSDSRQYDSAILYYQKTLVLQPDLLLAKQGLAYVYRVKGVADSTAR